MKTVLKTLCLLAFLATATQSHAQTKEETVKWLTEKMISPNFFNIDANKQRKIISVQLDENFLIINYIFSTYFSSKWGESEDVFQRTVSINLVELELNNLPQFITKGNNIHTSQKMTEYYTDMGETTIQKQENSNWYGSSEGVISVNYSFEPDIIERYKKAIEHYKTLMTVKKSNEIF